MDVVKYKLAPICERIVSFGMEMPEDRFQQGLSDWENIFKQVFPPSVHQRRVLWDIQMQGTEEAMPEIAHEKSKMSIRHMFWSSDPKNTHPDWCVQIQPNVLIFNLRQYDFMKARDSRDYNDLRLFSETCLSKFNGCFGELPFQTIKLEYSNMINSQNIGESNLIKPGWVEVKELLTLFQKHPGPEYSTNYVIPFNSEMNWAAKFDNEDFMLSTIIKTLPNPCLTLNIHFSVLKIISDKRPALTYLDQMRKLIHSLFDSTFTDAAKKIFTGEKA
jgi:uncharacterized protein (TIGR04255 family)